VPDGHDVSETESVSVIRSKLKGGKCSYALESDQNELFLTGTTLWETFISFIRDKGNGYISRNVLCTRHIVDMNNNNHVIRVLKEPTIFTHLERNRHRSDARQNLVVQVGSTGKACDMYAGTSGSNLGQDTGYPA
jgi:hypothetical protein